MQPAIRDIQVGDLVTERPDRARFFEKAGIDYCCHGKLTLAQACAEVGLNVEMCVKALAIADQAQPSAGSRDWSQASLTELIDHIEGTHHAFLRRELPRLAGLVLKVRGVHGDHHPELAGVEQAFTGLRDEIEMHMAKEEAILFPAIRRLDATGDSQCPCASIEDPIRVMEAEHEGAGRALETMRTLTGGYAPPADACNSYRAMLAGLAELEADLHRHIHKENSILFPRAVRAEKGVCTA
jgi:regulator of cell morphogenesis and NO signaling